ncbi:ABC transporter permease [Aliikangiella maris]|uniref:ABC transporter permease n=2 Tax=Aliikangiella maris TaxID=3162458 RepID=A0ABV2BYW6_9GAMM
MMNNRYSHQVFTVAKWEFMRFFKWKQELLSYLIMLSIVFGVNMWQEYISDDRNNKVIAASEEFNLPENERFKITHYSQDRLDLIEDELGSQFDAIVYNKDNQVIIYVKEKDKWLHDFKSWMSEVAQAKYLSAAGISDQELESILSPYQFQLRVKGENELNNDRHPLVLVTLLLLITSVFSVFSYVFSSITTEKQQRVTEQMLSTISPQTWIDGKILGISLLCFKSLITTALSTFIFYQLILLTVPDLGFSLNIEFNYLLLLLLFMVLGILMWNCLLAGFAATIDDPNHSSRSVVMLFPLIPIFLGYSLYDSPQSGTMQFLSYFPITSFAAMPIRMAEVSVNTFEVIISILLLIVSIYLFRRAAARLFNMGVMMYGREPGINEMIDAIFNNKVSR